MKSILVTAFEPFGRDSVNPTMDMVGALPDEMGGYRIRKLMLPVSFERAPGIAIQALRETRPAAVVSFGLAGGRDAVTPERRAVCDKNARIPDNDGAFPQNERISPDGPGELPATLPAELIAEKLSEEGIAARVSESAGLFVCNCLFYSLLDSIRREGAKTACGFVHVPYADTMGYPDAPSMDMETLKRAGAVVLKTVIETL